MQNSESKSLGIQKLAELDEKVAQSSNSDYLKASLEQCKEQLRDAYLNFKDLQQRCVIDMKDNHIDDPTAEVHKVYYFQPETFLLDEPEKQRQYRESLIRKISTVPKPEPVSFLGDELHRAMCQAVADRSSPKTTKETLREYFRQRQYTLQHMKYKLLCRWAHHVLTSEQLEKIGSEATFLFGKLELNLDQTMDRLDRLSQEDFFDTTKPENKPSTRAQIGGNSLYVEKFDNLPQSLIREDDVEVYIRGVVYKNKVSRVVNKFIQRIKWLPLLRRSEVFEQSIQSYFEIKAENLRRQNEICDRVQDQFKQSRVMTKQIQAELESVVAEYHCKRYDKMFLNNIEKVAFKWKNIHETVPGLVMDQQLLKIVIQDKASSFGLSGNIEIDNGNSFSYQVSVFFPAQFQKQVVKSQFSIYDLFCEDQTVKDSSILKPNKAGRLDMNVFADFSTLKKNLPSENDLQAELRNTSIKIMRLKSAADWLDYIALSASEPDWLQKQQAFLNNKNPIDTLLVSTLDFLDVNDFTTVLRIIDDNAHLHKKTVKKLRQNNPHDNMRNIKVQAAEGPINLAVDISNVRNSVDEATNIQEHLLKAVLSNPPQDNTQRSKLSTDVGKSSLRYLPHHLLVSLGSLTYLNSRESKIKLVYTLNYFRAIQKRLAIDLREFATRDRIEGHLMNPYIPSKEANQVIINQSNQATKSFERKQEVDTTGAFSLSKKMTVFDAQAIAKMNDMATLRGYKANGLFNNQVFTSAPSFPKIHSAHGEPLAQQSVSEEQDRSKQSRGISEQSINLMGRIDFIEINEEAMEVYVKDDFGIYVVYDCVLQDMKHLETELSKIASHYLNKTEMLLDPTSLESSERPFPFKDRIQIVEDILRKEAEFQFNKVKLVQVYMECYEHISNPLDQQRIMQVITDQMARRPRLDLEGSYFNDSYDAEIACLKKQFELVKMLVDVQISLEKTENKRLQDSLNLSYTLANEYSKHKWKYQDAESLLQVIEQNRRKKQMEEKRQERLATNADLVTPPASNDEPSNSNKTSIRPSANISIHEQESQKQDTHKESQNSNFDDGLTSEDSQHEDSYLKQDENQFSNMLGLPQITIETIYQSYRDKDRDIIRVMKEQSNFLTVYEGHPEFLTMHTHRSILDRNRIFKPNSWSQKTGALDFYSTLDFVINFYATCQQIQLELYDSLKMWDTSLLTHIDTKVAELCIEEYREVCKCQEGAASEYEGRALVEDEQVMGNSEKMIFYAKEMLADLTNQPRHLLDPFIIARLDLETIGFFNFPETAIELNKYTLRKNGILGAHHMEIMEKEAITRIAKEKVKTKIPSALGANVTNYNQRRVQTPSMLQTYCNMIELVRLRSELILTTSETAVLQKVYLTQCELVGLSDQKVELSDGISFDPLNNDDATFVNFIDHGPSHLDTIGLTVREFDRALLSAINFRNPDSFRLNILDAGLEEIRAILAYQIFQKQLLIVATRINSLLFETPQRALSEWKMMNEHSIAIPNSIVNYNLIYNRNFDTLNWLAIKTQISQIRHKLSNQCQPLLYNIMSKKALSRTSISKEYSTYQNNIIQNYPMKPHCIQRVMRNFKVKLLMRTINQLQTEIYLDAQKVQAIYTCQQLRCFSRYFDFDSKSMGLPTEKIPVLRCESSNFMDNFPYNYVPPNIIIVEDKLREKELEDFRVLNPASMDILELTGIPSSRSLVQAESSSLIEVRIIKEKQRQIIMNRYNITEIPELKDLDPYLNEPENYVKLMLPSYTPTEIWDSSHQKRNELDSIIQTPNYQETLNLGESAYGKLTNYYQVLHRVVTLEWFQIKLQFDALDVLKMEERLRSGLLYWQDDEFDQRQKSGLSVINLVDVNNKRSAKYFKDQVQNIRSKKEIAEAVAGLSLTFRNFIDQYVKTRQEKKQEYLQQTVEFKFQQIIGSLYKLVPQFFQQKNLTAIESVRSAIAKLIRMDHVRLKLLKPNNYAVSTNLVDPLLVNIEPGNLIFGSIQTDVVNNFNRCVQPIINEKALEPSQLTLFQCLYQRDAIRCCGGSQFAGQLANTQTNQPFSSLATALIHLNIKDRQYCQGFIGSAKFQANDFLETVFGDQTLKSATSEAAYNLNQIQDAKKFLNENTQALLLKNALICWFENSAMPSDLEQYNRFQDSFRQNFFWKQLEKKEELSKILQDNNSYGKVPTQTQIQQLKLRIDHLADNQSLATKSEIEKRDTMVCALREEFAAYKKKVTLDTYFSTKAEIQVYSNEIEKFLIKASIKTLEDECAAISRCFTIQVPGIQYHIHPFQQFAATLFDQVDPNSNLDVCNKVTAIQGMLTKIRNRGTEIETLTSGPGIVVTIKDINDILNDFSKVIIKDQEKQFKSRKELSKLQEDHYRNLIYVKDQKIKNYETRLANVSLNLENMVTSRLFEKGNQLIYELDSSNRVLQLFKNSIHGLETNLERQILGEQLHKFKRMANQVEIKDQKFKDYITTILNVVSADFATDEDRIKTFLKQRAEVAKALDQDLNTPKLNLYPVINNKISSGDASEVYGLTKGAIVPANFKHYLHCSCYVPNSKYPRPTMDLAEIEMLSEQEARSELARICVLIRKQRILYRTKEMCLMNKYQDEINVLKKQVTNNSLLWDQLAESQKREHVLKSELVITQQALAETEKAVEQMKNDLNLLDADKRRLTKFKNSKTERLQELEDKVKKIEIFEVVNSEKLVMALTKKDYQLSEMRKSEEHFESRLQKLQQQSNDNLKVIKDKLWNEQKKTQTALDKMDQLKLELKMLEQNDGSVASIWKKKCLDLFEVCQSMKQENDELRERCKDLIEQGISLSNLAIGAPGQKPSQEIFPEIQRDPSDQRFKISSPSFSNFDVKTQGISAQLSKLRTSLTPGSGSRAKVRDSFNSMKEIDQQIQQESYQAVKSSKIWGLKSQESQQRNTAQIFATSDKTQLRQSGPNIKGIKAILSDERNTGKRDSTPKQTRQFYFGDQKLVQSSGQETQSSNWLAQMIPGKNEQPAINKLKSVSRFQQKSVRESQNQITQQSRGSTQLILQTSESKEHLNIAPAQAPVRVGVSTFNARLGVPRKQTNVNDQQPSHTHSTEALEQMKPIGLAEPKRK